MKRLFFSLFLAILLSGEASAQLSLAFSTDSGSSFVESQRMAIGETLTVDVYLRDTDGGTTLQNDGLLGFELLGDLSPQDLGSITNTTLNSSFEFEPADNSTSTQIDWKAATFGSAPTGSSILLGSFDFRSTNAGSSQFDFSDKLPGCDSGQVGWLSGVGAELDQTIFGAGAAGSYQFTINAAAVPEPTASLLLLSGMVVAIGRRRRSGK